MTVRQLMVKDVHTCQPHSTVAEAASLMWHHDCGALPVVDAAGHVAGIVTDRDLCIATATRDRAASRIAVDEVMRGRVFTVAPEDDVQLALDRMREHQVRRLPVVDASGQLKGIVALNDLVLAANGRSAPSPAALLTTLKGICAHRHITVG